MGEQHESQPTVLVLVLVLVAVLILMLHKAPITSASTGIVIPASSICLHTNNVFDGSRGFASDPRP